MLRLTELKLPLDHPDEALRTAILQRLGVAAPDMLDYSVYKRSYDARQRARDPADLHRRRGAARGRRRAGASATTCRMSRPAPDMRYQLRGAGAGAAASQRPVVIGIGPCGLFAALILAQMGFRPIMLERGKAVRERTKDTFGLWRKGVLNPESNVQFGEGGAGTFSDGKLLQPDQGPASTTAARC